MTTNGTFPAARPRVLGIGGSTRQGSTSLTLPRGALRA